jgi:hypothetical protein
MSKSWSCFGEGFAMKSVALAIVAAGLLIGGAAYAQREPWNPGAFWQGAPDSPYQRIQFLQDRVNRGMADGSLDRREAGRVNHELNGVRQWIHHMHWEDAGRLTPGQRDQVQSRLDGVSRQIHWMRHKDW